MTNPPSSANKPAEAEPSQPAEAPAAAPAAPAAEAAKAHPDAKKARPTAPPPDPEKQKAQFILIFVIVAFAGAGLMMIPGVRHAIFGEPEVAQQAQQPLMPAVKKLVEVKEQPRQLLPMGQYTRYFGNPKAFAQEDGKYKRIQYYYLYAPQGLQPGQRLPLVVFMHDEEGNAPGAITLLRYRQQFPAYILVLMGTKGKTWSVPEKFSGEEFGKAKTAAAAWSPKKFPENKQLLPDVLKLVANLMEIYPIDDARIYAAGCGEGAMGVYGAAARYGEFFAAGIAVGGLWSFLDAPRMTQTPLVILHGAKDKSVDQIAGNGLSQLVNRSGGKAIFRDLPDFDGICTDKKTGATEVSAGATVFSPPMWKWLFGQRKAPLPMAPPSTP